MSAYHSRSQIQTTDIGFGTMTLEGHRGRLFIGGRIWRKTDVWCFTGQLDTWASFTCIMVAPRYTRCLTSTPWYTRYITRYADDSFQTWSNNGKLFFRIHWGLPGAGLEIGWLCHQDTHYCWQLGRLGQTWTDSQPMLILGNHVFLFFLKQLHFFFSFIF